MILPRFIITTCLIILYCLQHLHAQYRYSGDVRSAAIGFTGISLDHPEALFSNPAGIGNLSAAYLISGYRNYYGVEGLNKLTAGLIWPFPIFNAGIAASRFGDDLYSNQNLSLTLSNRMGIAALGARINWSQTRFDGYGSQRRLEIDFGGIAEISPQLILGASITNLNQAKLNHATEEKSPTFLTAGISYRPNNKVHLNFEVEKDVDLKPAYKAGILYFIHKAIWIGYGLLSEPRLNTFGLGLNYRKFHINYASLLHQSLGLSHLVSVTYQLKKNQK